MVALRLFPFHQRCPLLKYLKPAPCARSDFTQWREFAKGHSTPPPVEPQFVGSSPKADPDRARNIHGRPRLGTDYTPGLTHLPTRSKVFTVPPRDEEEPGSERTVTQEEHCLLVSREGAIGLRICVCACLTVGVEAREQPWFSLLRNHPPFCFLIQCMSLAWSLPSMMCWLASRNLKLFVSTNPVGH